MSDENGDKGDGEGRDADEMAARVASLLAKHEGRPDDAVRLLLKDNYDLRDRHRRYKADHEKKLSELQAKLPADGSVVLDAGAAEELRRYREAFGEEGFQGKLDRLKQLEDAEAERRHLGEVAALAQRAGYSSPAVLAAVLKAEGLTLDRFVSEKDGANWRVFVLNDAADPKAGRVPLAQWEREKWSEFLPSLRAASGRARPEPMGGGGPSPDRQRDADHIRRLAAI